MGHNLRVCMCVWDGFGKLNDPARVDGSFWFKPICVETVERKQVGGRVKQTNKNSIVNPRSR